MKLLIINILDHTLTFKSGLLWFTGKIEHFSKGLKLVFSIVSGQHADFPRTNHDSPYFRIIKKLQTGNEVR